MILPFADLTILYPEPFVETPVGSVGIAVRYFSLAVNTDKSINPEQETAPVLHASVEDVVIDAGKVPLLSIAY